MFSSHLMQASKLIKTVKYLEIVILVLGFLGLAFTLNGMLTCGDFGTSTGSVCRDWGLGKINSLRLISILVPIYGVLNSLHIGLDHYLNVGFTSFTNLFSVGLFGLAFSFLLLAFFKVSPIIVPIAQQNNILTAIYVVTSLTSLIFLTDTKLWHRDSIFVKLRLLSSIIYLVLASTSGGLGVLAGIVLIPINLLFNSKAE